MLGDTTFYRLNFRRLIKSLADYGEIFAVNSLIYGVGRNINHSKDRRKYKTGILNGFLNCLLKFVHDLVRLHHSLHYKRLYFTCVETLTIILDSHFSSSDLTFY